MTTIESIIAYLNQTLPQQQRLAFEKEMAENTDLQAAVSDYRLILEGFRGLRHEHFEQEIAGWDTDATADKGTELILAYLQDRLDADERRHFEQRLQQDKDLAERVATYRTMLQGFRGLEHENFQAQAATWAQKLPLSNAPKRKKVVKLIARQPWWQYAAAAVIVALLTAVIWLWTPTLRSGSPITFRLENYIAPGSDALIRGQTTALSNAARYFAKTDYELALQELAAITPQDSLYVQAKFLAGHSYYKLARYTEAVEAFSQALAPGRESSYAVQNFNRDNAAWTRILAQMALTSAGAEPETLEQMLEDFLATANQADTYYSKALALQKRMDNFW